MFYLPLNYFTPKLARLPVDPPFLQLTQSSPSQTRLTSKDHNSAQPLAYEKAAIRPEDSEPWSQGGIAMGTRNPKRPTPLLKSTKL